MVAPDQRGFLLLEVLVAGLILTASIACAMYIFKVGFGHLERADRSNLLSAKLLQASSALKIAELEKLTGRENLGDGVNLRWSAQLIGRQLAREPARAQERANMHDLYLYRVDFALEYQGVVEEHQVHVFRSRPVTWR